MAPALADGSTRGWDSTRLAIPMVVDGRTIPYREFAIYVMPGHTVDVGFGEGGSGTVHFQGRTAAVGSALTAPAEPGLTRLEIENAESGETSVINLFTLVPAARVDGKGFLNGYRIGRYPGKPLKGLDIYRVPPGFVEVTADNAETPVSPNFRLGQFVCKQEHDYPKYAVLRPDLLLKLEHILAALNGHGRPTGSLTVMSGYRTPFYNQAIGNVPYSRHLWGGAADIFVDEAPADGQMDDLNGDGKVDRGDARWLADLVNGMADRGEFGPHVGGLGIYDSNAAHGPFIHVDVRGTRARW